MPYRRTYKRKENPYKKRVRVYGRAGKQLYKDVMYLKSIVNAEPKYFQQGLIKQLDDNGTVDSLCNIAQGDGVNNRDGTSVLPRFLTIQASVKKNLNASAVDFETVKILIFRYWGEQTTSAPSVTIADILQDGDCLSFLNDDNTGKRKDRERRIELARSKFFTIDKVNRTSYTFKINIEVNGMSKQHKDHIKYRSNATEDPVSGGFYFLMISDVSNTDLYKSDLDFRSKLTFYDN